MQTFDIKNFFNFIAEKSPDIIEVLDDDLKCIYINPVITRFTGIPREDYLLKPFYDDPFFGKNQENNELLKESIYTDKVIQKECIIDTIIGKRYFEVFAYPQTDEYSSRKIYLIFRDITEAKHKDQLLNSFKDKFYTAAESLLQPLVILKPYYEGNEIKDFIYDYINEAGCIANNIPAEQTIGKRLLTLYPAHKELGVFNILCNVFKTGESWKDVVKYTGAGGNVALNDYFTMSAARTSEGIVVTWQNITTEVTAQEELKKSEERLYSAFNVNPVAMVFVDMNGRILNINKRFRQLLSYSKKEVIGRTVRELNLFDNEEDYQKVEFAISSSRPIVRYQMGIRDSKEILFQVIFSSTPIETTSGMNFLFTLIDITKQKELENSLIESLHEKDVLLKEIHHRVKNNLQIISSLLNLQSSVTEDTKARAIISETQNRVQSIALMHENLYKNKSLSDVKLDVYVRDMLTRIEQTYSYPGKFITSVVNIKDVSIDLKQCLSVGLILNELITNCYKYAFKETGIGEINISAAKLENNLLEITISDNGQGLPENFDLHSSNSLGLQLVTILTNQLDGNVTCRNTPGAEFKIIFPLK